MQSQSRSQLPPQSSNIFSYHQVYAIEDSARLGCDNIIDCVRERHQRSEAGALSFSRIYAIEDSMCERCGLRDGYFVEQ